MAIPNYKDIEELVKNGLTTEAKEKIMELRLSALELQEENLKLREKIQQLQAESKRSKNLLFDQDMYWLKAEEQGGKEGPFCSVCYDKDKKLVRLHDGREWGYRWRCPICTKMWIRTVPPGRSFGSVSEWE